MFQGRQRLGFLLGSDLGEDALPHLDPWRKRVTIGVDCVAEQPSECVGYRGLEMPLTQTFRCATKAKSKDAFWTVALFTLSAGQAQPHPMGGRSD